MIKVSRRLLMKRNINSIDSYYYCYTDIVNHMDHKKYCYMDSETYLQIHIQGVFNGNIRKSMQIYWKEILLRAHFAAVMSIIRNQKWLSGVVMGIESKNLMVFASSLRGFLVSVTDSYYSIESLPTSLSLNYKNINKAVKGELNQEFSSEELENKLIHFQFAERSKEKYQSNKTALTSAKYIELFDMYSDITIKELYSILCEITHPASKSLSCFTSEINVSENYSFMVTSTETDNIQINEILNVYRDSIIQLMKISLTASVVTLKILSMYDYEDIKSDYINRSAVNDLISEKGWNEVLDMMDKGKDYLK
jgi:hypothetical protein